ncbi:MAG: hypothetical protein U0835_23205 [Isosphaeraceae bacterium]
MLDNYNVFLPTGDAKIGDRDYALDSNSLYDYPARWARSRCTPKAGERPYPRRRRREDAAAIQTNIVRIDGKKEVSRSSASSAPARWAW